MSAHRWWRLAALPLSLLLITCGPTFEEDGQEGDDLPLGDGVDLKSDASWTYATKCKPIPQRPGLAKPRIIISIDGLTLHLVDDLTGFSKVYPVGVGSINHAKGELTYDKSLSLYPVLAQGRQDFTITTRETDPCKIWWTDKANGQRSPVFAGLPFLRWSGAYGIHGPVTNYHAPNGGTLQRGYVSHGCIRMEAADVAELWAYVRGVTKVPVRVQKEVEREESGLAVDLAQRWIISECRDDADCSYPGGVCLAGPARKFCSARCSGLCNFDRYGYPVTFCVSDENTPAEGYCTYKGSDFNDRCRGYGGFEYAPKTARFSQPGVRADVCLPSR